MHESREIITSQKFELIIKRLSYQIIETYRDLNAFCLIGIQPRGTLLSDCIINQIRKEFNLEIPKYGKIDITFYRDDYRNRSKPLIASGTVMDFNIEEKKVLLIDDVLYTGRSVHAAISALQHYGRPKSIELLTFVDRRFNREFPIHPDFLGLEVDALDEAYVKLYWNEVLTSASVHIYPQKLE